MPDPTPPAQGDLHAEEIPEQTFIERVNAKIGSSSAGVTRRQLRHLKQLGKIGGATQRRVPGKRGSVSMYLASEVDRVAALLTVNVAGQKSVELASRLAWLEQGVVALPSEWTSRVYIIAAVDQVRGALASDPNGARFLDLLREPLDIDADAQGVKSEEVFNLVEAMLEPTQRLREAPMIELSAHCLTIKDYLNGADLDEKQALTESIGSSADVQTNERVWSDATFREPIAPLLLNPREYLADVDDATIDEARIVVAALHAALRGSVDLSARLARLNLSVQEAAGGLDAIGSVFAQPVSRDPAFAVAYLAKKFATDPEFRKSTTEASRQFTAVITQLAKLEELVAADPSLMKKIEEIAEQGRTNNVEQ